MSFHRTQKQLSPTEIALGKYSAELERVSALYESLAMRIANLQSNLPSIKIDDFSISQNNTRTNWFRILRHMVPYKVRQLLVEHDRIEQTRDDHQRLLVQQNTLVLELSAQIISVQRDFLEHMRSETQFFRVEVPKDQPASRRTTIRRHGEIIVSEDIPEFPKSIFQAGATSDITIVDVGAQDLVSEEHIYAPLQSVGGTKVIGFEPLQDTAAAPRRADPSVKLLKYFIGVGGAAVFHITHFDPASSLLQPNREFLSQFVALPTMCEVVSSFVVQTTRLDDVSEIKDCDYLKIDVQGGELDVLKGAPNLLKSVITIHCEVEFGPVYKDQPLFAEIDGFLRANGFELIDFVNTGYNRYKALAGHAETGSRVLWAEAIYFKMPQKLLPQNTEKLLKAAYIAHVNYGMFDLAAHFLSEYDKAEQSHMLSHYAADLHAWKNRA
jgi:FkbM family methyltransferase